MSLVDSFQLKTQDNLCAKPGLNDVASSTKVVRNNLEGAEMPQ